MQDCVRVSPEGAAECSQAKVPSASRRSSEMQVMGWWGRPTSARALPALDYDSVAWRLIVPPFP
jgi:hypothetical protein